MNLLEIKILVGDISSLRNGYAFQSSTYNSAGQYKIITIANVTGKRYIDSQCCNCIFNKPNDIQQHQTLQEGDILISLTGNVGRVSLCSCGDFLLNQRVGLLQLNKGINREYIYQVLSNKRFEQSMISSAQGAAQMNIGKSDIENYYIPYSTNKANLDKVASVLKCYDDMIITENRMLSLLLNQKKYLLSQMFI